MFWFVLLKIIYTTVPSVVRCFGSLGWKLSVYYLGYGERGDSGAGGIDSQVVLNREVGSGKMCLSVFKSMNTRIP